MGFGSGPHRSIRRRFLPELDGVPDSFIHEPWKWPDASSLLYQPPILDNATATKEAKDALYALLNRGRHKIVARQTVNKIGNRNAATSSTARN